MRLQAGRGAGGVPVAPPQGRAMEVFRASDAPEASRAAYWSGVCSRAHAAPIVVSPSHHGPFQAELQLGSLGKAELALLRSRPASTERRSRPAGERMIGFFVL